MAAETDDHPPHQPEPQGEAGRSGGTATEGAPPYGWYNFGPEPPLPPSGANAGQGGSHGFGHGHAGEAWRHGPMGAPAPPHTQTRDSNSDLKEAFDRLSRGDLSADTIGKLLNLDDRDFWTGALLGAAAALLASNLPTLMNALAGAARPGPVQGDQPAKAMGDSE